jgi:uncharacterized protein
VDHSHPQPLAGQNVLSVVVADVAVADVPLLAAARAKMLAVRAQRIRPHRDDKVLASWNGLMLGAFARAGVVLNAPEYLAAAERNAAFIREKLWDAQARTLFHRWREGERDGVELLEGYAFQLAGVVELYEATLRPDHLDFACALAEKMITRFYDPAHGGFWQAPAAATDLILRVKDDYDGAEPSGNSLATLALLKLAAITGREDLRRPAETTLRALWPKLERTPAAVAVLLQALDFALQPPRRVVLAGDPSSPEVREQLAAAHTVYQPNKVVLGTAGPVEDFARTLPSRPALAYVCCGTSCQSPTADAAHLRELLRQG